MGCCNMTPPIFDCQPRFDMNEETLKISMNLTKDSRKAIKLLSKQYQIDSIRMDPPEFQDERIVREMPLVITYYAFGYPRQKFEWIIDSSEMNVRFQ